MRSLRSADCAWRLTVLILFGLVASIVHAAEPLTVSYAVICSDEKLAQRFRAGIEERFTKLHVATRERFPTAKLFVYANRDVNDTRNKEGISVAVAHVSNIEAANLGLAYVNRNEPMPGVLQAMLREEGMLMHLNVGHMSTASDTEINLLLDSVVTSFVQKYTNAGSSPSSIAPQ